MELPRVKLNHSKQYENIFKMQAREAHLFKAKRLERATYETRPTSRPPKGKPRTTEVVVYARPKKHFDRIYCDFVGEFSS